ncbi:host specificity factor TipJ family phage tail protein [Pseudomonas citronellolis]|uniref:host specificity factor TipJ family phage tail protein n=1 Tax=Pseudomonas citronellolis TaxID=53408 RepID=UPI0026490129|nr:host specificity factor TipJ family phage tail protein [Pseudomonas citronellolis]MDN6874074.1 host specificity factor TipJ family phage tail protein [Pseudomonas citronellolis]
MIEIYPSRLEGEPLERHPIIRPVTIRDWLVANVPSFGDREVHPISIGLIPAEFACRSDLTERQINAEERVVPAEDWADTLLQPQDTLRIYIEPRGTDPFTITVALFKGAQSVFRSFMPKIPGVSSVPGSGESLTDSNADANKVKLGDVIPELAGNPKRYPDYLVPPRKYFAGPREQWMEVLLCVGKGEYQIPASSVLIGDTALLALGADARYTIYGQGEDLSAETGAEWWHTATEVGATSTGTAGLELTVATDVTQSPTASAYQFNGFTITIPTGQGSFPEDWEEGQVIRVIAPYSYTVTDGTPRDVITGPLGMLNAEPGDEIEVVGVNGGFYTVEDFDVSTGMTLDYEWGDPADQLALGTGLATIGPKGLLYRIVTISEDLQVITVERLDSSGSTDTGWPGFDAMTSSSAVISLDLSGSEGGYRGPFPACPEYEKTSLIEVDVFMPEGLCGVGREGQFYQISVFYDVEWRDMAVGGAWTVVSFSHAGNSLDQQGFTDQIALPYAMRPEVRIRKVFVNQGGNSTSEYRDTAQWYGLRAKMQGKTSYAGVTTIAVKVRSSDRISSMTDNKISMRPVRILPTRSGGAWTSPQPTRDIVPWVAYVAKSIGYTDADLDLAQLDALDAIWKSRGDTYDIAITDAGTVKSNIEDALDAGFAELTIKRGKISPVRDQPRSSFDHMYTPQNMTEALVRSFTAPGPDDYDGVDVEYTDRDTWETATVECRIAGDVGRKVEKIKAPGVTDRDRAWRIGMRRRMVQLFRRWDYTWSTEMDAYNSDYLSYCVVADDVPGYAQSALLLSYQILSGGVVQLESSEPLDWSSTAPHVVAVRRPDGTVSGPYVATRLDDYTLTIPSLDFTPDVSWDIEPPHLLFGSFFRWAYPVLITSIEPDSNVGASVSAVNYDSRIYQYDDATAP